MKLVIHKKDRIDYILNGMAELYGVSRKDIYARRRNTDLARRKAIAIKLLVDVADCTLQEICDTFHIINWGLYSIMFYVILIPLHM